MAIVCRTASPEDWSLLAPFYRRIYPEGHPLQNREFWMWQYGDARHGQAFIVEDAGKVAGHLGASFGGGYAWIINVFLDPEYRGQGWVNRLYAAARERAPSGAREPGRSAESENASTPATPNGTALNASRPTFGVRRKLYARE